jgi:hypothetical protein
MEHVPVPVRVTVLPETAQTEDVLEAKPTARPDVAEAPMVKGPDAVATLLSGPKLIVCVFDGVMVNDRVTGGAAEYVELPGCVAVMEHVPAAIRLAVLPIPAQVPDVVLVKVTARPEDAVADRATDPAVNGALPGAAKEMV